MSKFFIHVLRDINSLYIWSLWMSGRYCARTNSTCIPCTDVTSVCCPCPQWNGLTADWFSDSKITRSNAVWGCCCNKVSYYLGIGKARNTGWRFISYMYLDILPRFRWQSYSHLSKLIVVSFDIQLPFWVKHAICPTVGYYILSMNPVQKTIVIMSIISRY